MDKVQINIDDVFITPHSVQRFEERMTRLGDECPDPLESMKVLLESSRVEITNSTVLETIKRYRFNKHKKKNCIFLVSGGWRFILYKTSPKERSQGMLPYTLITAERIIPQENKQDASWLDAKDYLDLD